MCFFQFSLQTLDGISFICFIVFQMPSFLNSRYFIEEVHQLYVFEFLGKMLYTFKLLTIMHILF